jgi:geranylgeranyl reductase family protein
MDADMARTEVVVVGAGPAGASTAYHLARQGLRVTLVDKESFPRDKVCGDGVTRRALRELARMGMDAWTEDHTAARPNRLRMIAPDDSVAAVAMPAYPDQPRDHMRIIRRRELDLALVDLAVAAGAQLLAGVRAEGMAVDDEGATVYTTCNGRRDSLRCQLAVAADGTRGRFSRSVGLQTGPLLSVAMRAYVAGDGDATTVDVIYDQALLPAYGWIFPMGQGTCNVGIGIPMWRSGRMAIKRLFNDFITTNRHVTERFPKLALVEPARGGALYAHFRHRQTFRARLLAVGDAAGLVNPLTGSGVSKALISGRIAALSAQEALERGDCSTRGLAAYGSRLRQEFGGRHARLMLLQWLFRHKRVVNRLVSLLREGGLGEPSAEGVPVLPHDLAGLASPSMLADLLL